MFPASIFVGLHEKASCVCRLRRSDIFPWENWSREMTDPKNEDMTEEGEIEGLALPKEHGRVVDGMMDGMDGMFFRGRFNRTTVLVV